MTTVLLSAGDASGEAAAAELVEALRARRSDTRFVGLGGAAMKRAGVTCVADARSLAVGGLFELASSVGGIVRAFRAMDRALRSEQPDLVVLVDSGGFNLPFARRVRRRCRAPILYFIAPQIWAWRPGRLRKLVARTDRIAVLMPFEGEFYARQGVAVDCVGHPILDRAVARPRTETMRAAARDRLGLSAEGPVLALFPGSRRNELERNLPIQLASAAALTRSDGALRSLAVVVGLAPSLDEHLVRRLAEPFGDTLSVRLATSALDAMDAADAALCKPGTITLELMLRGCPMAVMARIHPLSAFIARRRVSVPFVAMPNLLAGEEVVPELLLGEARPDRIAAAVAPLLGGKGTEGEAARARQLEAFARIRPALGSAGAIGRVASIVEELLGTDRA